MMKVETATVFCLLNQGPSPREPQNGPAWAEGYHFTKQIKKYLFFKNIKAWLEKMLG